nr:hypothetical protein [Rhodococcus pyridinivorans]
MSVDLNLAKRSGVFNCLGHYGHRRFPAMVLLHDSTKVHRGAGVTAHNHHVLCAREVLEDRC